MTLMTTASAHVPVKKHSMPNFEMHSVLLLGALVLACASAAHAQAPTPAAASPNSAGAPVAQAVPPNQTTGRDVEAVFLRADTNRDGKLDRKEAERLPAVSQRFEQIDTDHDNFISLGELNKAAGS